MKPRTIGIIILVLIVGGALLYQFVLREGSGGFGGAAGGGLLNPQSVTVRGYIGSEKSNFLDNDEVKRLLRTKHGLEVDYRRAGSIEMIDLPREEMDFLWPSSQVALELYRLRGGESVASETIFSSPIVLYSWAEIADALASQGIATRAGEGHVEADVARLLALELEGAAWGDIGMSQLFGNVVITSTDPTRSNSGNLFAGLVANLVHGGVVDESTLPEVLDEVVRVFRMQGFMEHSTGTLYEQYLTKGMGPYPLIVGYENQIVEFSLQNPGLWESVRGLMAVIYPVPTVYSEHPLIALNDDGRRLIEALADEEIQDVAWMQHGFRTGIENDPAELGISGIPRRVTQIIRMPVPAVMDAIITALQ